MKKVYTPLTQQPYCCVPASLQIVMYRRGLPLVDQDSLGYELGLIVPEEHAAHFTKVYQGEMPPSGWGTRIYLPEFEPNAALRRLGIPLQLDIRATFSSVADLERLLKSIDSDSEQDALVCFDAGIAYDNPDLHGHVCVFDGFSGRDVQLVDPGFRAPKRRTVPIDILAKAIDFHGPHNSTGVWIIKSSAKIEA